MDIAVLGMGRMGRALAGRLLEGGHRVTVWNRTQGKAGVVDGLEPVLSSLSDRVRRYDTAPLALTAKLANNLLLLSGVVALAESFAVGRSGGLSDDQLRDLLGNSPLVAPGLKNRFEGVLTGSQEGWWTTLLGAKDAGLTVDIAPGADVDPP